MSNQTPSRRPADEGTLAGVISLAIQKALQSTDGMMPVEVVAYDRATNRATVRHLIQMTGSDGQRVSRANVSSVRVMQPGNGAFSISLPIKPGDKGWLMAADRDLSIFQDQGLGEAAPNTDRMKSFQDGVFMPDAMSNGNAPAGQDDKVVIGSNSGSAYMSFDDSGFEFKFGGNTLTMDGAGLGFSFGGNTLTMGADGLKMNGKNIGDTHTHGGVTSGAGNTAGPNA